MKSSTKAERAAAGGVVGVGDAARAVGAGHDGVVADDGLADPGEQRRLGQPRRAGGDLHGRLLRFLAPMVSPGGGTMVGVSIRAQSSSIAPTDSSGRGESSPPDVPWVTVVWNDPVNLMTYVAFVFQEYFGYDRAKAEKLMLQVHQEGRSAVSNGSREEMERDVAAMHGYGLWATMQQDR